MLATLEQICLFCVKFQFCLNKLIKSKNKVDHKFSVSLFNQNSELELKNKRNNSINLRSVKYYNLQNLRSVVTQVTVFQLSLGCAISHVLNKNFTFDVLTSIVL